MRVRTAIANTAINLNTLPAKAVFRHPLPGDCHLSIMIRRSVKRRFGSWLFHSAEMLHPAPSGAFATFSVAFLHLTSSKSFRPAWTCSISIQYRSDEQTFEKYTLQSRTCRGEPHDPRRIRTSTIWQPRPGGKAIMGFKSNSAICGTSSTSRAIRKSRSSMAPISAAGWPR